MTSRCSGGRELVQGTSVTVIIPNYNYAKYVAEAIDSVLSQSYKNCELIVVNNGSTDDSLDILREYGDRIRVIDQPNLGQSGARNSGLRHARGDFIAFLDADDSWEKNKIEKQISLLTESTQLIYCGIRPFRSSSSDITPIELPKYKGDCTNYFLEYPGASIVLSGESTALFSRSLLERVGEFDPKLNSTAGWDFFRRCSKLTKFGFINESLVNYRLHDNNMSNSSVEVILDMRRAYIKLFSDKNWEIPQAMQTKVEKSLELSYLKTYLKAANLRLALNSTINLIRLLAKFS